MDFNINQLNTLEDDGSEEMEYVLDNYQDNILDLFLASKEGIERAKEDPDLGFWSVKLIYYGFRYIGTTLPKMNTADINEILTDIFPRKISLSSPKEANDVIPELLAFWTFLQREYSLKNADAILRTLQKVAPDYYDIMNDSSRFGMAKSFLTLGQNSGFDMSDKDDINTFMNAYNQTVLSSDDVIRDDLMSSPARREMLGVNPKVTRPKKVQAKKKNIRKMKKASRKKNKKKKKR